MRIYLADFRLGNTPRAYAFVLAEDKNEARRLAVPSCLRSWNLVVHSMVTAPFAIAAHPHVPFFDLIRKEVPCLASY